MTDDRSVMSLDESPRDRPARKARKHLPVWQETLLLLGIALVLAIVIKALFVQAFYIPSESMEPGLVKNDRILVEKVSYWFGGTPRRGDVRRAKLYYLRNLRGKAAKIKERREGTSR